jgi:hypothetical protein
MSKSRGTGISPLKYLDLGLNPEWLRYYIAAKLNSHVEDIDFNPRTSSRASTATWSASTSTSPAAPPASWQALRDQRVQALDDARRSEAD